MQHRCFQHEWNKQKTDSEQFQRTVSVTTFLNEEDGDFQIHSNEEKTS